MLRVIFNEKFFVNKFHFWHAIDYGVPMHFSEHLVYPTMYGVEASQLAVPCESDVF